MECTWPASHLKGLEQSPAGPPEVEDARFAEVFSRTWTGFGEILSAVLFAPGMTSSDEDEQF
jgi:hypothetical protein